MSFFDENPMHLPFDANYYFDVCIIHVAVRRSLGGQFEDIWDLSGILEPRPFVYHIFLDDENTFDDDRRWDVEVTHHCVIEVSDTLGVSFFVTDMTHLDEQEEDDGEFADPNDFWRF